MVISAYVDAKLMRMVLENLLDNASKYSRDGKTITISLEQIAAQTIITITDAGVRIMKKDQKKYLPNSPGLITHYHYLQSARAWDYTGSRK